MSLSNIDEFRGKLRRLTEADYLWRYLLPPRPGYSLLLGEPGAGKTNLAFQVGGSIAAGIPCLDIPTTKGRVGMVVFEGGDNLTDRIDKLEATFGRSVILNNFDIERRDPSTLKELEKELSKDFKGYDLGIIDPFVKIFDGNVNNTQDMSRHVRMLDRISAASGAHILVNHHLRKRNNDPKAAMRVRDIEDSLGSGQLVAGCLTAFLLAKETQDDMRRMGLAHHRGAPTTRGQDFMVLHTVRAQASPSDPEPLDLWRDRDSLTFKLQKDMMFI